MFVREYVYQSKNSEVKTKLSIQINMFIKFFKMRFFQYIHKIRNLTIGFNSKTTPKLVVNCQFEYL